MFKNHYSNKFKTIFKWFLLCLIISILIGSASAIFLTTLDWATNYREYHSFIIYALPFVGFLIGCVYKTYGKDVESGNNLLIETILEPRQTIPFRMTPMVYLGTILSHLFGGSAGREGTALQMAGSIADQFSKPFKLNSDERKILIIAAIAGGFAAVFGTPLTGAIFSLELILVRKISSKALIPAFATGFASNYVCKLWKVPHTHYHVNEIAPLNLKTIVLLVIAGVIFGLCALCFSKAMHFSGALFKKIKYQPIRPLVGGIIIIGLIFTLKTTKYIGLGIPTIVDSFDNISSTHSFILKLIFTVVTLASGFKGGEVTPLFFIGATLGSALSFWLPIPTSMLAGLGFVAVFAGATNTPFACATMACELFGFSMFPYALIVCLISFLFSGNQGIYTSQVLSSKKHYRHLTFIKERFQNL